jgi:type IV pilus assembly protein PilA
LQVTEGLSLAASAKIAIAENAANGKAYDSGWTAPAATTNVASVGIVQGTGVITITYSASIDGGSKTILVVPSSGGTAFTGGTASSSSIPTGGSVEWNCTGGTLAQKYRPAVCRT